MIVKYFYTLICASFKNKICNKIQILKFPLKGCHIEIVIFNCSTPYIYLPLCFNWCKVQII